MISYADNVGELEYNVSANFTYSRFRNVETYKPRFGNSWNEYRNSIEDRWGGVWWGYQVIGQFQSEEEIRNYPINNDGENNRTQLPGDLIYKDVNGDGIINSMDERPIPYRMVAYAELWWKHRLALERYRPEYGLRRWRYAVMVSGL